MAVRTPPAAILRCSILAEPEIKLSVVQPVHVAVAVEIQVPQVAGVGGGRPERGLEAVAVLSVHVPVAVRVAEQPEERVDAVAPRDAVAVPVQLPARL